VQLKPVLRSRVLRIARHAAIAGGLGIGWLLLSGTAASAASDHTSPGIPSVSSVVSIAASNLLPGVPVSPPSVQQPTTGLLQTVSSVVGSVTGTVSSSVQAVPSTVTQLQTTAATVVRSGTTTLDSTLQTVPTLADPLLTGPLAPIAPVVDQVVTGVGNTIASTGNGLGDTVSTLPVSQVTQPVLQITEPVLSITSPQPAPGQGGTGTDPSTSTLSPAGGTSATSGLPTQNTGMPGGGQASNNFSSALGSKTAGGGQASISAARTLLLGFAPTDLLHGIEPATLAGPGGAVASSEGPNAPSPVPSPGQQLTGASISSSASQRGHGQDATLSTDSLVPTLLPSSSVPSRRDPEPSMPAFDPGATPD
jgi:hypothetical protein